MNNYLNYKNFNFQNGFDEINNKKNKKNLINFDNKGSLYDPYQGFIRGNMFENLYDPYKLNTPYEIRPMNKQAELLTYIDSLSFACMDLNLYLDVHPNDQQKIDLFNQYRNQKNKLMEEYESEYGPLLLNSNSLDSYPWTWNNKPWPWDN